MKKVSIITVVYNSETLLERTIQSVISQTYPNIEFLIIDGGSKDNTLEIIKKYEHQISYWISEPDNGLYDAMNKGLKKATGDYVWFLNSGDQIYSINTTATLFNIHPSADIYYGETLIVDIDNNEIGKRRLTAPEKLTFNSFKDGMLVCHQSIIIKKAIAKEYNLKYKITADFDWVLLALKNAETIVNTHQYICRFLDGGLNKKRIPQGLKERFLIMSHYYGFLPTLMRHFLIGIKFFGYVFKNKRF